MTVTDMSQSVTVITDSEFQTAVIEASATQPVLVYFWAGWCGPCRLMSPIMDKIAQSYGDRLKVVKMEVDPNPTAVQTYKVEGVPALRLFQDGTLLEAHEGAMQKQRVEEILAAHIPAEV